ncbi:non-oxidative hydroxyarylic acid decarboxylases subunit C [Streptomyces scopuliridis]|uniref:non-oxidative hydroxyarylic acid decarboxylases subunit C n=1 Tax=Streptomyces scopuliridis TaxID=452529 RepID=UPI0034147D70
MPYADLRAFLDRLAKERRLLHIEDQVAPEPDLGAAAKAAVDLGEAAPALLFSNVHGYERARVAVNVHGSWAAHALMLDLPPDTPLRSQFDEFVRRWDNHPMPVARSADAPFTEHSIGGDDINLFEQLPLSRLNEHDGGFYIDKAVVVSRDPDHPEDFGRQNTGIYRLQVKGPRRLGIQPVPVHDIAVHLRLADERAEELPVAIALGNEPVIGIVAGMPIPYDASEYEMAGAIQGAPYPVVAAPLTGLDVPVGAEIVIEGAVLSRTREIEGPFGEFTGYYSGVRRQPVIRVDRVWHRTDPIFEHLYLGKPWTEIDYMFGINTGVPIFRELRSEFPEVVAVNALYTHGLVAIVSTRQRYGGFAKAVGLRTLTTRHGLGYCKLVIVVDEDVDPYDMAQVMWAVSSRFNPEYDLVVAPRLSGHPLDPSSSPQGMSAKMIIDATAPVAPDLRGGHARPVRPPATTDAWTARLRELLDAEGNMP